MKTYYVEGDYVVWKDEESGEFGAYVKSAKKSVEISAEVYSEFTQSEWKKAYRKKKDKKCLSLNYEYEAEAGNLASLEEYLIQDTFKTPEEEIHLLSVREIIRSSCSLDEQKLLYYIYWLGLTEEEASLKMGIPRSTLHSRKITLLKKLKNFF